MKKTVSGIVLSLLLISLLTMTFGFQPVKSQDEYTLTISYAGDGSGSVSANQSAPYHYGDIVELTAMPAAGSSFSGWSDDLSGSTNPTTITIDGNKVVTATFTLDQYTLTVNIVGSGSVSKSPDQATYTYGTVVTLTATADPGWTFAGWSGNLVSTTNPDSIIMKSSETVTATFVRAIIKVTPCNALGNPQSTFSTGSLAYFKVVVNNTGLGPSNVLITVNIYDSKATTIGVASFQGPINTGITTIILGLPISTTANLGQATVYASLFTDWIQNGGVPICPEASATFTIVRG